VPAHRMFAAAAVVGMILTLGADADEPKLTIGGASAKRLREDLRYFAELAPAPLNKKWTTLEDTLKSFEQGVNIDGPIQLDFYFAGKGLKFSTAIPLDKLTGRGGFIENLESFGFDVGKPNAQGLIEVKQAQAAPRGKKKAAPAAPPQKPFYMRELKAAKYVVLHSEAAGIPANLPDPSIALNAWIKPPVDVAIQLKNDAAGLKGRQDNFAEMRKELEAAIQFKRSDSEAEIELRKLSLRQNLAEAERFLVESEELAATWVTDPTAKSAKGDLSLSALAGTSLEDSIKLLCEKPSAFANVKFHPKPALQIRVNFPIDELRSGHAKELYPRLLPVLLAQIDDRPALNDAGKTAAKNALNTLFEMLTDSIPMKLLDGFVDVHATSDGKNGLVCGIRAADGTQATAALEEFPDIRDGWKFEKAVAEHGGVTIHAMTVAPHRMDEFRAICGGEPVMLIGVSKDIVWGAAGQDAMTKLKTAIDQAAAPLPEKADPVFASLQMRFAPWVEVLDILRKRETRPANEKKTAQEISQEKETERQRTKLRKIAQDAFAPSDDLLTVTLRREDDTVHGHLDASLGIQRFLGSVLMYITDEFLE
jgi:hypothetical protein